jgi:hypothetical protein
MMMYRQTGQKKQVVERAQEEQEEEEEEEGEISNHQAAVTNAQNIIDIFILSFFLLFFNTKNKSVQFF